MIIKKIVSKVVQKFSVLTGLSQNTGKYSNEVYEPIEGLSDLARSAIAEGTVLLKNDGVLPLSTETRVAVFGRCQHDWFYVGYGSGGDVNAPYKVNLMDAMRTAGVRYDTALEETYRKWGSSFVHAPDPGFWGHFALCYDEMKLKPSLIAEAASRNDVAIVVIGRAAGEDMESVLKPGSFYLNKEELRLLEGVTSAFDKTIVILNSGNVIDVSWLGQFGDRISALVWAWQGGMESGNGLVDVLTGKVNPSGKLSTSIAQSYEDYPSSDCFGGKQYNEYREDIYVGYRYFSTFASDKVAFPFGYGLSYTTFEIKGESFLRSDRGVEITVSVTNMGDRSGKEVVQVYLVPPCGKLGRPAKELKAFAKTRELLPGETQSLSFVISDYQMAAYDDEGVSGYLHSYVLEGGRYGIVIGNSVADDRVEYGFDLENTICVKELTEVCGVKNPFPRMVAEEQNGKRIISHRQTPVKQKNLAKVILDNLPEEIPYTGDSGIKLVDVLRGKAQMRDFVAQLNDEELERLTRGGGYMFHELGADGNGGVFGGTSESLRAKGVPIVTVTDGPSGVRLSRHAALLPCGTLLACTWNEQLLTELYQKIGIELLRLGSDVLLGPGMNIHRNPLCGRNFEYYSEDPLLSGKIASAVVKGVQSEGGSACIKHFACNNQEVNRNRNDSRVSVRALREIYLKGFEICVEESKPQNLMTSYNLINGVWSHYNYDLVQSVLRGEWGYEGNVMTDWWMRPSYSPEFPTIRDHAYRVRAGVDLMMPGNTGHTPNIYQNDPTLRETLGKEGGISRCELQRCAIHVLEFCLKKMAREEHE